MVRTNHGDNLHKLVDGGVLKWGYPQIYGL